MIKCDVCDYVNECYEAGDQCDGCGFRLERGGLMRLFRKLQRMLSTFEMGRVLG